MRHGKKFNHLGMKAAHRDAMLSNMATSLIINKRITTTVAKAKELRKYVEPLITKAKSDTTHNRRIIFSYLQNKETIKELFDGVVNKVGDRPGGYTRIIKLGSRLGDNAEMCMMELVDYNNLLLEDTSASKTKTRRSRRAGKKTTSDTATVTKETAVEEELADNKMEATDTNVAQEAETATSEVEMDQEVSSEPSEGDVKADDKEDDKAEGNSEEDKE